MKPSYIMRNSSKLSLWLNLFLIAINIGLSIFTGKISGFLSFTDYLVIMLLSMNAGASCMMIIYDRGNRKTTQNMLTSLKGILTSIRIDIIRCRRLLKEENADIERLNLEINSLRRQYRDTKKHYDDAKEALLS